MDTVVYDRIEDVLGRIESLYGRVEDTYLVAKDILLGTQISDWIADLKASGTASATYGDSSRMNVLVANEDAANNSDVAKYLVQWAVANNKFGTYCGAACGAVSGVTWDSLTTPNAVMGNAAAFTALCGNSVAFKACLNLEGTKDAIVDNATTTESIIRTSNAALSVLNGMKTRKTSIYSSEVWFLLYAQSEGTGASASGTATPNYLTGSHGDISVSYSNRKADVNRFVQGGTSSGQLYYYCVVLS